MQAQPDEDSARDLDANYQVRCVRCRMSGMCRWCWHTSSSGTCVGAAWHAVDSALEVPHPTSFAQYYSKTVQPSNVYCCNETNADNEAVRRHV